MQNPERPIYAFIAILVVIGTLILTGFGLTQDYLSETQAPTPAVVQAEPAPMPVPVVVTPAPAPMPMPVAPAPAPEPPVYVVQPAIVEPTPPAVILTEPCRPSGKPVYRNPYSAR